MPIELQCPDCEHVFKVPSSMAGQRTLCRGCNAALIVPEGTVEEPAEPEVRLPPPRSQRVVAEEKPPNWDTPIPFHSPGPIVGVLLIALAASTVVIGLYAAFRDPTAATRPAPFTGTYSYATQPTQLTKTETKPTETKSPSAADREVLLPNREVIIPKFGRNSKLLGRTLLPRNWLVVRESGTFNPTIHLHEQTRGSIVASIEETHALGSGAKVSASPSGRWVAVVGTTELALFAGEEGTSSRSWKPYTEAGRTILGAAVLSDERLLTVSSDYTFDLWAIPSGDYIRRVAVLAKVLNREAVDFDVCYERSLLAIRNDTRIEIHSLEDDAVERLVALSPSATRGSQTSQLKFSPDGKKIVAVSTIDGTDEGSLKDRVEVFDIAARKRTSDWILPSNRGEREPLVWSAGSEFLVAYRSKLSVVNCYQLGDGKLRSTVEIGESREGVLLDPTEARVWFVDSSTSHRLYGFDLPLPPPAAIRKDPVWDYRSGTLELRKAGKPSG